MFANCVRIFPGTKSNERCVAEGKFVVVEVEVEVGVVVGVEVTQEISAMKQHCVEARQALDINDFAHCAYEIDAALKVGAGTTAVQGDMLLPANVRVEGPPEARSAVGNRQAQLDGGPSRTKGSASHHG